MPSLKKIKLILKNTQVNKATQTAFSSPSPRTPRQQLRVKKTKSARQNSKVGGKSKGKEKEKKVRRKPSSSSGHYGGDEFSGGVDTEFELSPSTQGTENREKATDSTISQTTTPKPKKPTKSKPPSTPNSPNSLPKE
jgi:hypothetical protein